MQSYHDRISPPEAESILGAVRASSDIGPNDQSLIVHDLDRLRFRLAALIEAFPKSTLHAVAIKANPLVEVLRVCVQSGCGLEAASMEEVYLALAAGCPPQKIIFDSPAKTIREIEESLHRGIHLNVDNFVELSRIDDALGNATPESTVGLRINPEVQAGTIATTSVGSVGSKFGISISRDHQDIINAFRQHAWLNGLHIHVGSQGCGLDTLCDAAVKIQSLREEINSETGRKVSIIDIGGGLPAAYLETDNPPLPAEYASRLATQVAPLFDCDVQLMTEFGRSIQAGCGIAFSRVEYVREVSDDHALAVIHLGADFLLRPVYRSDDWKHEFLLFDGHGRQRQGEGTKVSIAGPLCFAGDILARELSMPRPRPGDWIAIRDVGAYTLGMWSRHCSRGIPTVLGRSQGQIELLRSAESPDQMTRFWSKGTAD